MRGTSGAPGEPGRPGSEPRPPGQPNGIGEPAVPDGIGFGHANGATNGVDVGVDVNVDGAAAAFEALAVDEVAADAQEEDEETPTTVDELDRADGIAPAGAATETSRPRTHQITSALRVVPQIDYAYRPLLSFREELQNFMALCPDLPELVAALPERYGPVAPSAGPGAPSPAESLLLAGDLPGVLYFALGSYQSVSTSADHESRVRTNLRALLRADLVELLPLPPQTFEATALWALVALLAAEEVETAYAQAQADVGDPPLAAALAKRDLLTGLVQEVAARRWEDVADLPLLGSQLALFRLAMLAQFGGRAAMAAADRYNYKAYGLDGPGSLGANGGAKNGHSSPSPQPAATNGAVADGGGGSGGGTTFGTATPDDYELFRQSILLRYPAYVPPDSQLPLGAFSALRPGAAPGEGRRKQLMPSLSSATTPASIEEACQLFRSRIRTTPQIVQLWREHEAFVRTGLFVDAQLETEHPDAEMPAPLRRVQTFYAETLLYLKSFLTVVANYLLRENLSTVEPTGLHAATTAIRLLLEWFRLSHVLKHEYLGAVLFDLRYHLVAFKFCARHPILETVTQLPPPEASFWSLAKARSQGHALSEDAYGPTVAVPPPQAPAQPAATEGVRIEQFSVPLLESFIALLRMTRDLITDKVQRIIIVAELPASALRQLMAVSNHDLWQEVLYIFKLQAPFNGKKWRYMNMELISAIYLHCESKLNDDWLSGTDVVNEIRAASFQEEALRELIELYNARIRAGLLQADLAEADAAAAAFTQSGETTAY